MQQALSIRAYARQRGCTMQAVRVAIEAGRLSACLVRDHRGKAKIADPVLADKEWEANTRHDKVPPKVAMKRANGTKRQLKGLPLAISSEASTRTILPLAAREKNQSAPPSPAAPTSAAPGDEAVEEPLPDDASFSDGNRRLILAKARKEEMLLAERRGELVSADEVRRAWATVVALTRTKILLLPSKAKQHLPHLTHKDIGTIESLVREGLEDLCQASALPN